MSKWNVYVTREIPEAGLKALEEGGASYEMNPDDRVLTRDELLKSVKGRDAVLCLLTDKVDGEVLDAAQGAKIFANYAVGYDNVDVQAATERGMCVTNTPGVLTETTADLAWALLMSAARRIPESDRYVRAGKFKGWGPMLLLGVDIYGATLGIVGPGRIGTAVARRGKGFGMEILYCGENPLPEMEELGAKAVSLQELLTKSDFVSLHTPLTPETRHMIGAEQFAMMKDSAVLVNTARGPVVDEAALVEALRTGAIAGAGLDVFENEPALAPGLAELDRVVIAPHIGSASVATRSRMAEMTAENILAALEGRRPENLVNGEVWSD